MAYITRKDKERILIDLINESLTIYKVITELFRKAAVTDKAGKYSCPLHNDKTPSLSADKFDRKYNCFSCPSGGRVHNLILDGVAKGLIAELSNYNPFLQRAEVLLATARIFGIPLPFTNLEDEVTGGTLETQVTEILARNESPKAVVCDATLTMRFRRILRDYDRASITAEQALDVFTKIQHEASDDPSNLDELYTSISSALEGLSIDDLMGED